MLLSITTRKNDSSASIAEQLFGELLLNTNMRSGSIFVTYSVLTERVMLCAEVVVEGFRQYPAQRSVVLDDIMGAVLPNLPTGKCTQRAFLIGDEEQLRTQMVSALILQLVQVSSELCSTTTAIYALVQNSAESVVQTISQVSGHEGCLLLIRIGNRAYIMYAYYPSATSSLWCGQVSVQLPTTEVETSEQKDCFAPAMHWAGVFWNVCLQR